MDAYVVDGLVAELIPPREGFALAELYAPAFVAACVPVPSELTSTIAEGWSWDGTAFTAPEVPVPAPRYIPAATLRERIEAQGKWDEVAGLLTLAQVLKLATLREGIAPDDAEMLTLLNAAGVDVPAVLDGLV
jgi:hypothetical protein